MFARPFSTPCRRPHRAFWLVAVCAAVAGCGVAPPPAAPPPGALSPATEPLCSRIAAVVNHARNARRLDAAVHGAWQVVHGILAFGPDFPLAHEGSVSPALEYLLGGGRITGWQLRPGDHGVVAVVEEGSTTGQGHPDQWLGYLSQCGLGGIPLDTKLVVAGRDFTLADLLAQAKHDIRSSREATWTLMALTAYLPPDASWKASDGSSWTIERVVQMEADADLSSSACGGAHRLTGLALALAAHRKARANPAAPLTAGWAAAADRIADAIDRARAFQQADGSFSTHFFDRPGTSPDVFARLGATGHIFEVLTIALDDDDLAAPWVTRAAERLVTLLEQTADVDVECGGLYHAIHGLMLYNERMCPGGPFASIR
jgi:hypothetical protein